MSRSSHEPENTYRGMSPYLASPWMPRDRRLGEACHPSRSAPYSGSVSRCAQPIEYTSINALELVDALNRPGFATIRPVALGRCMVGPDGTDDGFTIWGIAPSASKEEWTNNEFKAKNGEKEQEPAPKKCSTYAPTDPCSDPHAQQRRNTAKRTTHYFQGGKLRHEPSPPQNRNSPRP